MNKESPPADAPVPLSGTEQAADQAANEPPPADESSALDAVASVIDGVTDVADVVGTLLDIFD